MTVYDSVMRGIDFIEANLSSDIGVCDVASSVCYSQFYFSRQFSILAHTSVYDYILKRKLSESYKRLFAEKPRIIDLAMRYGFSSHEVYTRAFRKMFGENPSEVSVFKPLLLYEPVDEAYLGFLNGLNIDIIDRPVEACFFEPDDVVGHSTKGSFLVHLSKENCFITKCILQGSVSSLESSALSFNLRDLKHKIRIHHHDEQHSMRYFFDNFFDAKKMVSNFVLFICTGGCIDVIVPEE